MASPAVLTSLLLLGIIGLFGTIVSVVLMVVLRQSSIVRTSKKHPTPYTPSNPSYHTTLNLIFNGDFEWGRQQGFVPDDHISTRWFPVGFPCWAPLVMQIGRAHV
mgnify:CR=1 FL=1